MRTRAYRLQQRHRSTVVTSYLGGHRTHFIMDPHDIATFSREGSDKFSFLPKSLILGADFSDFSHSTFEHFDGAWRWLPMACYCSVAVV